jgi:serine/threonine protein kinase
MQTSNFLAKGSYGCVFYPSINACSGKIEDDIDSDHYITKIQSYLPNKDDEIVIGKQIQELPLYDHYFAPVVKSCKINTIKMDYNLVRSCAEMQNELGELKHNSVYVSNKIRYVGKHHIFNYMQSLTTHPQKLYRKLINTHLHILDALQMLVSENIVHFDIKSQNIMYDEIQDVPIIIDFGLSREITPLLAPNFSPLKSEKLLRHTFVSYDTYDYWCIDIYILSNIGSNTILKPHSEVSEGHIKLILRGFITPNFLAILSADEVFQFKQNTKAYFSQFIEHKRPWMDVFRVLIQNYSKWDNYSLAMTYLYNYLKTKPTKNGEQIPAEIKEYLSILRNIVTAMPDKRPLPQETQKAIREVFETTSVEPEQLPMPEPHPSTYESDHDDDDDISTNAYQ